MLPTCKQKRNKQNVEEIHSCSSFNYFLWHKVSMKYELMILDILPLDGKSVWLSTRLPGKCCQEESALSLREQLPTLITFALISKKMILSLSLKNCWDFSSASHEKCMNEAFWY